MFPNLVIIGAMKCATVSLHLYLGLHPQIAMTSVDELDFFIEERNWKHGLEWYKSQFKRSADIVGERSTSYTKFPTYRGVAKRLHDLLPDAKLIYCIRDPIDRIVSQYVHHYARGYEHQPFEKAIMANFPGNHYIYYSQYYHQLEQYLTYFPTSNIMVVRSEDLANHRKMMLQNIFGFLNVDPYFEHEDFNKVFHLSGDLKRSTWFKKRLGHLHGMYRLERISPWLFKRKVKRPVVHDDLRAMLMDVLVDDYERACLFTTTSTVPVSL